MKFRKKPVVIEAIKFTGPGSFGETVIEDALTLVNEWEE